ncbi:amidohydrolase family protein [Pseudonocardia sp. CA-142604]|uniref:amidohydrolase family protein n=1 Tax=Pseudonocardia sp. CA-142604 TaxID=3240024 RepID=UPI003D8DF02D
MHIEVRNRPADGSEDHTEETGERGPAAGGARDRSVEHVDLMVAAGAVATMDERRRIIRDGAVAVRGTDIVAVGKRADLLARYRPGELIDAPGALLTPGLIDAHHHPASGYLLRGQVDERPRQYRLTELVVPHESTVTADEARVASLASLTELLRHGTTTFVDAGGPFPVDTAQAAAEVGIRGVLAQQTSDLAGSFARDVPDAAAMLAAADAAFDQVDGMAGGRLRAFYCLDEPSSVSDELVRGVVARVRERDTGLVGHFIAPPSGSPNAQLSRYADLGVLDLHPLLAHIGWLSSEDVELFARSGAAAVHCPSASVLGGSGFVSHGVIPELVEAGAEVLIGTDSAAIGRFLDLVRVMYLAACTHKDVRRDPLLLPATSVFEMATVSAARALGWADRIGSLEPGKAADLVVFDISGLAYTPNPFIDPVPALVYGGSGTDVTTVVVDGAVVVRDGVPTTIDVAKLVEQVDAVAGPALARIGARRESRWPVE